MDGTTGSTDMNLGRLWELAMDREPRLLQPLGSQSDTTERLNCTELHVGLPLGFAPEAALKDLGLPLRGPGVEVVQLLGSQGF